MDAVMLVEQIDPHGHRVLRQRFDRRRHGMLRRP